MLKLSRRVALAGLGALIAFGPAAAADWPQKPVTVIVPQAAGNSPDVLCRIITDKLSRALGQQFVVENRPGAANVVGMQSAPARRTMATPSSSPPRRRSSPTLIRSRTCPMIR